MVKEVNKRPAPKNRLRAAQQNLARVAEQLQATNLSLANMRQMYEATVGEKQAFKNRMVRAEMLVTAMALQGKLKGGVIKKATLEQLKQYGGFDLQDADGDLIVTPISIESIEELQAEFEESEDEQE